MVQDRDELGQRGIVILQIEGGATLLKSLLAEGLADELQAYLSAKVVGHSQGCEHLPRLDLDTILDTAPWKLILEECLGEDRLYVFSL